MEPLFPGVRLHVVSGKGGTGKTTVAAALALALASGQGRRVLLCEVEGRQGIAQLFDTPPLPYEERTVARAPGGGEVVALAIDPEEALLEYLEMFYKMRRAGGTLRRLGAIDFATTIAPGMRDVLLTGKVMEATRRRAPSSAGRGSAYDAVVLDAPPTGRIARFLNVNAEVSTLARVGPIKGQAESVMGLIRSPQTAVHLVTILEEMPVQETADGVAELAAADLSLGAVVVNMVATAREPLQPTPSAASLAAGLAAAGLPTGSTLIATLLDEVADHTERVALEAAGAARLATLGRPLVQLPLLADAVDLGGLLALAEDLRACGLGHQVGAA